MKTEDSLNLGEFHPSANSAMAYVKSLYSNRDIFLLKEAIASNAIEGSRLCDICLGTLERIEKGEPVSDRYLLGLAWFLKELKEVIPEAEEK